MIPLSSSCRARGHRKQIGALGVLALASSWFNLHLARPFALLVTGCLSIIPSTPLRNLSSTPVVALFPSPPPPLDNYPPPSLSRRSVGPDKPRRTLFCCFILFLFFQPSPLPCCLFRARENCQVYRPRTGMVKRGGEGRGGRRNARIAVKRWGKCASKRGESRGGEKNGIFDDGYRYRESKWAFDRLERT